MTIILKKIPIRLLKNSIKKIKIVFNQNNKNIGYGRNSLKSVSMAKWRICMDVRNDDLILPDTFNILKNLINKNSEVDFFYINSFHLTRKF